MGNPVNVFISYSHKDEALKDELYVHLAPLIRQGQIKPWQDRAIEAGTEWEQEIKAQLELADIILLLITPRFLASDYCFDREMQRAMVRHDAGTARVVPVIMKPCYWQGSAFSKLQVLPKDGKPLTTWADQDEALLDVVQGILRAIAGRQQPRDLAPQQTIGKQVQEPLPVPIQVAPARPAVNPVANPVANPAVNPAINEDPAAGNFTERLGHNVELEMVKISAGQFWMGSPDSEVERRDSEGPQRLVTVSEFWLGKYPVTQAQWTEVAALPKVDCDLTPFPSKFKGATLPVETVSWYEAVEFCHRLSQSTGGTYRLPSEAEWEYACRAGTTTPYAFGDRITAEQGNCDFRNMLQWFVVHKQTSAVGSFPANACGLCDMHGNVREWCADYWHETYAGAPTDSSPWLSGGNSGCRVLRGGSWISDPRYCRSARRINASPVNRDDYNGFRVVCSAPRSLQ